LFDVDVATSPEGNLHIRFKRSPKTKIETIQGSIVEIDPSLRVPPEQFGHIEWILTDLGDKGTKAEFYGEKLDFTYNIRNIFDESLRLIHRAVDTGARRD